MLIGLKRSAVGTVVERKTRYTLLVHLPREEGYWHKETPRNKPALAGYGAITMKNALANTMSTLPAQLARSLTWDRGKEMSAHAQFRVETGIPVFFADTAVTLTARHEREHKRSAATVLPEGHRLLPLERRRHRSRRPRTQQWAPQVTRVEDSRRGVQRAATVAPTTRCCIDRFETCQFRSRRFQLELDRLGLVGFMDRVGAAGGNAAIESFFVLL